MDVPYSGGGSGSSGGVDVIVAESGTESTDVDIGDRTLLGVQIPATLTGTTLGFKVSADGVTFGTLYSAGAAVSLTVAAAAFVALDPNVFLGKRWLRLVVAAQAAERTFKLWARQL